MTAADVIVAAVAGHRRGRAVVLCTCGLGARDAFVARLRPGVDALAARAVRRRGVVVTPREVLLKAAELVERGWCQGHGATDKSGNTVDRDADDAACFCALGAISRATQGTKQSVRNDLFWDARARLGDVVDQAGFMGVAPWNDAPGRTQAEVVQALRQAAEACE